MALRRYATLLTAVGVLASGAAAYGETSDLPAAGLSMPHLNVAPLTDEDVARTAAITRLATSFDAPQSGEDMPGGDATFLGVAGIDAFTHPSSNLTKDGALDFQIGRGLFRKEWEPAPSPKAASDGLGPLYNTRSCFGCHVNNGRGRPPEGPDDSSASMMLKLSVQGGEAIPEIEGYLASRPEPTYGWQLQDQGQPGHAPEARVQVTYEEVEVRLSGGQVARLRTPTYGAVDLGYGPLHPETMLSPRVAPQMIGLGLLEAVPAADILALADPDDADGDGISGRPNVVWSLEQQRPMLGRFGHKASTPTIAQQSAGAFSGDLGISSPLVTAPWGDCTEAQDACRNEVHGDGDERIFEIGAVGLELVAFYSRNLAVPARRNASDPEVLRGKKVFYETGCVACHQPNFVTHRLKDQPSQSAQLIWPYTDMLLHDMGPGLADNRPEHRATGQEWRTPPLWGIGLAQKVSGHTNFLHDGRARNLLEAVLWHGGEAQAQRDAVVRMSPEDRTALIRFLESL